MDKIMMIVAAAFLVEFVVQAIKQSVTKWEIVATGTGVLIAVLVQANLIDLVMVTEGWRWWVGVVLTGIIIGRGASFVNDLLGKLKGGEILEAIPLEVFEDDMTFEASK